MYVRAIPIYTHIYPHICNTVFGRVSQILPLNNGHNIETHRLLTSRFAHNGSSLPCACMFNLSDICNETVR